MYSGVHTIAYYYHWAEEKILKLTSAKRKMYIEYIRAQVKAENGTDEDDEYDDYDD